MNTSHNNNISNLHVHIYIHKYIYIYTYMIKLNEKCMCVWCANTRWRSCLSSCRNHCVLSSVIRYGLFILQYCKERNAIFALFNALICFPSLSMILPLSLRSQRAFKSSLNSMTLLGTSSYGSGTFKMAYSHTCIHNG